MRYLDMSDPVIADKYLNGNFLERLYLTRNFWRKGETINWFATTEFILLIALVLFITYPLWKKVFSFLFYKFIKFKVNVKYLITKYKSIEFFSIRVTLLCKHYEITQEKKATEYDNITDASYEEIR